MSLQIRRAAVLGAGVMGAAIAAHLAGAGVPVMLFDIVPGELTPGETAKGLTLLDQRVRNRFSLHGLETVKKAKPSAFYDVEDASLITPCNLEDDVEKLRGCDWVIEAVVEKLAVKQQLYEKIEPFVNPSAIVSSNTSGLSIAAMVHERSLGFQRRFLGVHFFNPPRYMKLVEMIAGPHTGGELIQKLRQFIEERLGKGVVLAKDTPNFIANRIGTYGLAVTLRAMGRYGLSVGQVDALTGKLIGRPKSATFRTLDLVGLDTFFHVLKNVQHSVTDKSEQAAFALPDYVEQMVAKGWLGEKSGQGFYRREKRGGNSEILELNPATMEYGPKQKIKSAAFEAAKSASSLRKKLQAFISNRDAAGLFVWDILKEVLLYTAQTQEEIASDILAVDNAMKWGFNWELGPYEIWDAIGVAQSVQRMQSEGATIPSFVQSLLESGHTSFYEKTEQGSPRFYIGSSNYQDVEEPQGHIHLARLKEQGRVIRANPGASLVDIGDGVACLEFHSPKQAIGEDIMNMMDFAAEEVSKNWNALVLGNEAPNFCVGANLMLMLMEAQDENWDELNQVVHRFQQSLLRLKYLDKPVIAAPFGLTLGGGAEVCLAADGVQASAETYIGLVEVGVGLIPGGGGTKEMLLRSLPSVPLPSEQRLDVFVQKAFETVAMAKVSTSAKDARRLHFLRDTDGITSNRDRLLYSAKESALGFARGGYLPKRPPAIPVIGESGAAALKAAVYAMKLSGLVSAHDETIAKHLIHVMTGGNVARGTHVSEDYLLDLEREAFLSLIGEPKTQQRMEHMLATGKPLRN